MTSRKIRNVIPRRYNIHTDVSNKQTGRGISIKNFSVGQFYSKENRQTMGIMEQFSMDSLFGDVQRMDKRQVSELSKDFRFFFVSP